LSASVIIQTNSVSNVWQRCAKQGHGAAKETSWPLAAICIFAKTASCNSSCRLHGKEAHE